MLDASDHTADSEQVVFVNTEWISHAVSISNRGNT